MADGLLPPYGEPAGPVVDDAAVLSAFARGEGTGHSEQFHTEGAVLVARRDVAAAMRIGPGSVLVRRDLPESLAHVRAAVEEALAAEGMSALDQETLLAAPVAVQILGLRLSSWDLWGRDLDGAFTALRAAAVGEPIEPLLGGGTPPPPVGDF